MKKQLFLLVATIFAPYLIYSQIGINTENPRALFHIDGASTPATTNPSTGAVSAAQAIDDVVIDNNGNVGIGILNPTVKIDIYSSIAGRGIRIADGTQNTNRVLVCDAQGNASWGAVPGTWFAGLNDAAQLPISSALVYRQYVNFATSFISQVGVGSVNKTMGSITVPLTGKYRISINPHMCSNISGRIYLGITTLAVNGIKVFDVSACGQGPFGIQPSFINIVSLNANDVITLFLDQRNPTIGVEYSLYCSYMVEYLL